VLQHHQKQQVTVLGLTLLQSPTYTKMSLDAENGTKA
jgi:hypothetical protein